MLRKPEGLTLAQTGALCAGCGHNLGTWDVWLEDGWAGGLTPGDVILDLAELWQVQLSQVMDRELCLPCSSCSPCKG